MKRIILCLLSCFILLTSSPMPTLCFTHYALIGDDCYLYSDANCTQKICLLPPTYFVTLISSNPETTKVGYELLEGYVLADKISIVDYTPQYKYHTPLPITVHNDGNTITLRQYADHLINNNVIRLDDGEQVFYYGSVQGSTQIEQIGSIWHFVRTENGNFGYVYQLYANAPTIQTNDYTAKVPDEIELSQGTTLSSELKILLIVGLCLPVVGIFVVALKKGKST